MSTPTPPVPVEQLPPPTPREIKLVSHSPLFYWWPVWFFGFFMASWTAVENNRFAVVPPDARIKTDKTHAEGGKSYTLTTKGSLPKPLEDAVALSDQDAAESDRAFPTHVSQHPWLGTLFVLILMMTICITSVPLRGLLSFLVLMGVIVIALLITVFNGWDGLYEWARGLRIFINMAGYLTISTVVFVMWAVATFIVDRRSFISFTAGQIRYCEHIGAAVKTFDAAGAILEKQRDDLFRHYILGFGSGDLIVKTSGADKHEIRLQNVLGIGWKLDSIYDLLREKQTTPS